MPGGRANFLTGSEGFAVEFIGVRGKRGGPTGGGVSSPVGGHKLGISSTTLIQHRDQLLTC